MKCAEEVNITCIVIRVHGKYYNIIATVNHDMILIIIPKKYHNTGNTIIITANTVIIVLYSLLLKMLQHQ